MHKLTHYTSGLQQPSTTFQDIPKLVYVNAKYNTNAKDTNNPITNPNYDKALVQLVCIPISCSYAVEDVAFI
jgi:hypothetical protein